MKLQYVFSGKSCCGLCFWDVLIVSKRLPTMPNGEQGLSNHLFVFIDPYIRR